MCYQYWRKGGEGLKIRGGVSPPDFQNDESGLAYGIEERPGNSLL